MEIGCTNLTQIARSVQQLKINGWSVTSMMAGKDCIKSSWNVNGYEWEVQFFPAYRNGCDWVALKFIFVGEVGPSGVSAGVTCRLVDPTGKIDPSVEKGVIQNYHRSGSSTYIWLIKSRDVEYSEHLIDDSLTVECVITVLQDLKHVTIPSPQEEEPLPTPPSDMHQHFGELLEGQTGADVTFNVAGESFVAHKLVLAARSPVFRAEFFGNMQEMSSQRVQIEDMEAAVFKAMLHYIYTDTVPELDDDEEEKPEVMALTMAQHLLAAADRYGLDRLKVICHNKLSRHIDVETVATTLALAEQFNCSQLKAKCVDFITESSEKLHAVMATEGYKHLVASCPSVLNELLKAAHDRGRKN